MLIFLLVVIVLVLLFGADKVKAWASGALLIVLGMLLISWLNIDLSGETLGNIIKGGLVLLAIIGFLVTPRDQWMTLFLGNDSKNKDEKS